MPRLNRQRTKTFFFPDNLNSAEHQIFVGSWVSIRKIEKESPPLSFYGVDIISRKICPDISLFIATLSEIFSQEFSIDTILDVEFVIPSSILKEMSSTNFRTNLLTNKDEMLKVWSLIATHETTEFLNHLLLRIDCQPVDNYKAHSIVNRLLDNFSTGQLWSLAYKASQKTCEVVLTKRIASKTSIPDLFLDLFLEKSLLYVERNWNVTPFKRWGFQCKQSDFSKFFFDYVLGISEEGFNSKPSMEIIGEVQIVKL